MEEAHEAPNYMVIFYWLFGLTVAELAAAYAPISKALMIAALVALAIAKASLVAMYFMHLRFENRTLALIALTPPVLLVMFLGITYPDTAWRFLSGVAH